MASFYSAKAERDHSETSYSISFDEDNIKLAKIKLTFTPDDGLLYMGPGANQLPKRWATFVNNLKATNSKGKPIIIEELPGAIWKISPPLQESIILTYEVKLDHEEHDWSGGIDGVAYATDWGVFYSGRSLFIMNGEQRNNINVDFNLPPQWKVTTPWQVKKDNKTAFPVNNLSELTESLIFAGRHEEISIIRDDFELVFALGGDDIIAQKDDFEGLAAGVLDYYIELMGGIPNPPPSNKFNKAVVIINSHATTDGEVIGNSISILIEKDGDQMSKIISRFIFAHEFFHLWNGKSFSPVNEEMEWFKEGFTNYYTLKSLYHVGFLNNDSYFDILNNLFFQRYNNDDGIGKLSMTMGSKKHDHWGLIYSGGLFVSIAQDIIIRKASNNKKSIDDVMRGLFSKYGGTDKNYTIEELRKSMSELSGIDQSDFFNTFVSGNDRIPIAEYLSSAGLDAKIDDGQLIITKRKNINPLQQKMINGLFGK
jgi:predicted metalloprotease with PDZ domain